MVRVLCLSKIFYSRIMIDNVLVSVTDPVNTILVHYMLGSDFGSLPDARQNDDT